MHLHSIHQWLGRPWFNPKSSHTKDSKIIVDISLHHKVHIKGKVEQSPERNSAFPFISE